MSTEDPSHQLLAVDYLTGHVEWTYDQTNATLNSSPAVTADAVYVGSNDKLLHAVDKATGQRKWTFPTCNFVFPSPAVDDDGMVYVACNTETGPVFGTGQGAVYAVNPNKRGAN